MKSFSSALHLVHVVLLNFLTQVRRKLILSWLTLLNFLLVNWSNRKIEEEHENVVVKSCLHTKFYLQHRCRFQDQIDWLQVARHVRRKGDAAKKRIPVSKVFTGVCRKRIQRNESVVRPGRASSSFSVELMQYHRGRRHFHNVTGVFRSMFLCAVFVYCYQYSKSLVP